MIGIPTPYCAPSLSALDTCTGSPGFAECEVDVDVAGADDGAPDSLDGALAERVWVTVTGEPLPLELHAVTANAVAAVKAPRTAADRGERRFLTGPP
jgi:hypothetical protein